MLVFLARRAGQVVSRDELLGAVWPGVVVGDDALTQAIIKLRKALGDDARRPAYIETLAKRGYRLIAPVAVVQGPGAAGVDRAAGVVGAAGAPAAAAAATAAAPATAPAAGSMVVASSGAGATGAPESSATAPVAAAAPRQAAVSSAAPTSSRAKPLAVLGGGLAAVALTIAAGLGLGIHRHWPWPIGSTEAPHASADALPVIAVLPLVNASGNPAREFFSDGVTDEIIHALGRYAGLRVISRNSVQQFKQREASTRAVSRSSARATWSPAACASSTSRCAWPWS